MKYFGLFIVFALKLIFFYYLNAIIALDLNFSNWHYIHRAVLGLMVLIEVSKITSAIVNITHAKLMEESNG